MKHLAAFVSGAALIFPLLTSVTPASGEIYNPAADFERGWTTNSNPNGVWTYGYSSSFSSPITPYDQTAQGPLNGPYAQYWLSSTTDIGESPSAEFNNGPAYADGNINFLANEFLLVAGIGGQYSDLVFTVPSSGDYSIAGSFFDLQVDIDALVGIVTDGNVIFNSSVTPGNPNEPFDINLELAAGNTVVFSVGPGGGLQNTGLALNIATSSVPEPSTWAMMLLGFAGLGFAAFRASRRASAAGLEA